MNPLELFAQATEATIVDRHEIPPREERMVLPPPAYREGPIQKFLRVIGRGREHIWMNQGMSLEALDQAYNIVMATGTGSGKSLVFQAAVIRKLLDDPQATAVALYPAKALVSDQLARWEEAFGLADLDPASVVEIHGDIPLAERDALLARARLVVATPDIVQAWIMRLLSTGNVKRFLRNLGLIVIDEAHDLDGVFGSNSAFLFRRLQVAQRRARQEASLTACELQFIAASATIANPAGHLEALTGVPFVVVGEEHNGAPRHAKTLVHIEGTSYGAPAEAMLAGIVGRVASKIAPDALIAFVDGRQAVERIATSVGSDKVEPYRAGFELGDRMAIANAMRSGALNAVIATSSLELGVDFPQFSLGLTLGIPPSKKSFRQRIGRTGRAGPSAFAVIAEASAFAQLGTTLAEFFESEPEISPLYLSNPIIQYQNARCLFEELGGTGLDPELPADMAWPEGFAEAFAWAKPGAVRPREIEHLASLETGRPHLDYPLRKIGDGKFELRLCGNLTDKLGTIDDAKALREAYPGAHYLHRKRGYEVTEWRTNSYERSIYLKPVRGAVRTSPIARNKVLVSHQASELLDGHFRLGKLGSLSEARIQVTESVEGFRRGKADYLYRELSQKDRRLSRKQRTFSSTAVVLRIDEPWFCGNSGAPLEMREKVGEALIVLLCRERGISPSEVKFANAGIALQQASGPRILNDALVVYDNVQGGLRLTEPLFSDLDQVLNRLALGAKLAGKEALLDEISVQRLKRWHRSLEQARAIPEIIASNDPGERLIYAPGSVVGVRFHGALLERKLLNHQVVALNGQETLLYAYETAPGVSALVPHDQIEATGHDWRHVLWDPVSGSVREIAA